MTKKFIPSPQQADFLDWAESGTGSCVLEAVAGAGKTTTILEAADRMRGQVALLAYNKKIADELKAKLAERGMDWKKAQAGTVHSFGFSAYRKAYPSVRVDDEKVSKIFDATYFEHHPLCQFRSKVLQLASLGKQSGIGVLTRMDDRNLLHGLIDHHDLAASDEDEFFPAEEIVTAALSLLDRSSVILDVVDFDDMVWMPLLKRVRFWQFDVVMVDEAQDTNEIRRALVRALVRKGGRVIAVGDRHQAIYGFTGADADSLDRIQKDFSARRLPLTVTYRCPKAVVRFAQQWVSHIEAHPSAPEGSVERILMEDFLEQAGNLGVGDAILCRNTRPLVELALRLIRQGVPCRVEGRDVAQGLRKLATRWRIKSVEKLEERLEEYLEKQRTALLAKKQESRLAVLEDTVETLRVVIAACRAEQQMTVSDVVARIDGLFGDDVQSLLVLSTIHKSKGREWPRVWWLDRQNTCPSPWARQQWMQDQENNLCYVAATRAQERLIDVIVTKK